MKNKKLKLFKVYYFTGDAMSSKGEQLHYRYERAESEKEIEYLYEECLEKVIKDYKENMK